MTVRGEKTTFLKEGENKDIITSLITALHRRCCETLPDISDSIHNDDHADTYNNLFITHIRFTEIDSIFSFVHGVVSFHIKI